MSDLSPEARNEMIRKKAQEVFEKRGRKPGHELDDWLAAEKFIDRDLQETKVMPQADLASDRPLPINAPGSRTPSKFGSSSKRI